jgi:hypothetical protein
MQAAPVPRRDGRARSQAQHQGLADEAQACAHVIGTVQNLEQFACGLLGIVIAEPGGCLFELLPFGVVEQRLHRGGRATQDRAAIIGARPGQCLFGAGEAGAGPNQLACGFELQFLRGAELFEQRIGGFRLDVGRAQIGVKLAEDELD